MRSARQHTRLLALVLVAVLGAGLLGGCGGEGSSRASPSARSRTSHSRSVTPPGAGQSNLATRNGAPLGPRGRPNIVFVLTDDLSRDLLAYMPHVMALQRRGLTFRNYFVSDSLCCPSRASIFTGDFPHDTEVLLNAGPRGGIKQFWARGDEEHVFNLALARAGYRTAMMGKYLNGYLESGGRSPVPSTYVPAGWSEWDVAGWGYPEYDYTLNENGRLHRYGHAPQDYLTSVIGDRATRFIDQSADSRQPFFLELATFTPHHPYTPAPRDARAFPGLAAPRPPNFDVLPSDAPDWLRGHRPLTRARVDRIDRVFRRRAQDVLSIDRMIDRIEAAIAAHRLSRNTYVVFSSDNGYHTGEYRLMPGKLTAFDTDIHVPLVIAGPGIPRGSATDAVTENVDLASTFAALGHARLSSDGHSLVELLRGRRPAGWRNTALIEHEGPEHRSDDPDRQDDDSANPTTYAALRTDRFLYVRYANGQHEFYDLHADPFELDNVYDRLAVGARHRLQADLARLRGCHSGPRCWAAAHLAPSFLAAVARQSRQSRRSRASR